MNNVNLVGRLTRDPEIKSTNGDNVVSNFTLAVRRNADEADFVDCTAWNKTAELICKYCKKGDQLAVNGSLRCQNYTNNEGVTVYKTYTLVNGITLISAPQKDQSQKPQIDTPLISDDDFPF